MKRVLGLAITFLAASLLIAACTQRAGRSKLSRSSHRRGRLRAARKSPSSAEAFSQGRPRRRSSSAARRPRRVTIASTTKIRVVTPAQREGAGRRAR